MIVMVETLKILGLFYLLAFGGMYYLSSRGKPIVLPGDIYKVKGNGGYLYLPIGSALYVAIILVLIFKTVF